MRRILGVAGSTVLLVAATVAGAGPAHAANVACGQTLVASTVLDGDIGPCAAGVVIGASNITFDLNGHTITGAAGPGQGAGVLISGRTGVTVKNGTISGFDAGVAITGGSANQVLNLALTNNLGDFTTDFGDGVAIFNSTGNLVQGNQVVNNGPYSGVSTVAASNNTFDGNQIVNNNLSANNTAGVRLENIGHSASNGNVVTNNVVSGSGTFGVEIFAGGSNNVVRNNQVTASRLDGITAFAGASNNTIATNTLRNNGATGIRIRAAAGDFPNPTGNQLLNNNSFANATFDLRDDQANCDGNQWHGNVGGTGTPPCVFNA